MLSFSWLLDKLQEHIAVNRDKCGEGYRPSRLVLGSKPYQEYLGLVRETFRKESVEKLDKEGWFKKPKFGDLEVIEDSNVVFGVEFTAS